MRRATSARESRRGSALIIVLWVCLGIIGITLYFARSVRYEMRAADNRVSALQAEQAIAGALRYASNILVNLQTPGLLPDENSYEREDVPVGDAASANREVSRWGEAEASSSGIIPHWQGERPAFFRRWLQG